MKKIYALLNTLVIILVIWWNYYSNTGNINGNTVGELSDKYENLFTPAGYAFAIWGLIFLALIALAGYQLKLAFLDEDKDNSIMKIGPWLTIANIANGAWLWFWLNEKLGISVLIMLVILCSLLVIIFRLNMQRESVSRGTKIFVHWPIALYSGWITVATIANVTAWLVSVGWDGGPFSGVQWTIIMIVIAGLLNVFVLITRNMPIFAGVGVWALIAIAVRHWEVLPALQWTGLIWAFALTLVLVSKLFLNRGKN